MEGGHHAPSGFARLALLFGLLICMRMFGVFQEEEKHNQSSLPWRRPVDVLTVGTAENSQRHIHICIQAGIMLQRVKGHWRILHLLPETVRETKCFL